MCCLWQLANVLMNVTVDTMYKTLDFYNVSSNSLFQEAESDSGLVMMDYLFATAYQGTPLAQSVLGTTQSLT